MQYAILLVCLGNICRSPLAEAAFRKAAMEAGLEAVIDSAGTGAWHVGNPPDRRSIAKAAENGIAIGDYRARQAVVEDFDRFTHIFAMDEKNLADLQVLRPSRARAELALLMDCVPGREGEEIADPYYGGADGFEASWRDVSVAASAFFERIR